VAIPSAPTDTTIVIEAWNKFGISAPSAAQVARGITFGLEQVKDKIMTYNKRWAPLSKKDFPVLQANVPYLALPTDFSADMVVSIVDGFHTAQVAAYQVGPPTILTLAVADTAVAVEVQGKLIFITAGAGVNQAQTCISYNPGTQQATMDAAYPVAPQVGDTYLVESIRIPLGAAQPGWKYDSLIYPSTVMRPWMSFLEPNANQGQMMFYPVPDKLYGVIRKYYANLRRLDTATVPYTKVQWDWRDTFIQGVFWWICNDQDDQRKDSAKQDFMLSIKIMGGHDVAGYDLQSLGREVADDYGDWGTVGP
jgi:hypothetical protein